MTLWQQLQAVVEHTNAVQVSSTVDDNLLRSVRDLSVREGYQPDEMILILLDQAVKNRRLKDRAHRSWDTLSPREKQVAALVCAGLTGRQIAARLVVSPETIKTHVRHIRLLPDWWSRRKRSKPMFATSCVNSTYPRAVSCAGCLPIGISAHG
jgi:DNA-directed RNA polymerase specialized sigma24 family protein